MSVRNLDAIFRPNAVALIGASTKANAVGHVIAQNLMAGGFEGPVMPVNPKYQAVNGVLCYPDAAHLPVTPDLAIICTPPETVPGLIAELGARGTRGAIVVTAGFNELGSAQGRALQQAILDAARPHMLRIVGPNCIGVISSPVHLNASFAHLNAKPGAVAFVAQSGAMLTTVLDWATARGIGFSHLVSLGDMTDVDFGDMLDFLADDNDTRAILLYVEAVTQARKFMSAARAAARAKPVIVVKAGRHAAAAKAAASHTGALAGVDAVYDAAFQRAGLLRVLGLDELFDAVEILGTTKHLPGDNLAILTNGGGAGVLATDAHLDHDGVIAQLSDATMKVLNAALPPTWSHGNPVDIIGDAPPKRYSDALSTLLHAPEVDAVLVLNCPTAVASSTDAARAVIETAKTSDRTVLTNWLGTMAVRESRDLFAAASLPTFETPDEAVRAFSYLTRYRKGQEILMEVPPSADDTICCDETVGRAIVDAALKAGQSWLDEEKVHGILTAYKIPAAKSAVVSSVDEAVRRAKEFSGEIALKIYSPDITHKSDVGGVALDLRADGIQAACEDMLKRVKAAAPNARMAGFVLQEMITRPHAHELILGMTVDALFGPVILFGRGGTAVEVIADKSLALAPLNLTLAQKLIARTRVYKELKGYRGQPAADLDAIALTLVRLSQLACDLDEIVELDINPLLADENGVVGVDARIRVAPLAADVKRGTRLAIRPYPKELESEENIPPLGPAIIRPIRPEDAAALLRFAEKLSPEDVRMRFFSAWKTLPPAQLARLTQIDYDRAMAFVMFEKKTGEIAGVARFSANPDNTEAEFAIVVRTDLKGQGLGRILTERLIAYARTRGIGEIHGQVLHENTAMLAFCKQLGFSLQAEEGAPELVKASLKL
jgi:acetyltransferase